MPRCFLQMLGQLDLSQNFLSGNIPWSMGNLRRLSSLSLYINFRRGIIPQLFKNQFQEQVYLSIPISSMVRFRSVLCKLDEYAKDEPLRWHGIYYLSIQVSNRNIVYSTELTGTCMTVWMTLHLPIHFASVGQLTARQAIPSYSDRLESVTTTSILPKDACP